MEQLVNFKELKAKVGVDDIAYSLGYRLDRKAGVGRYIEMVLPDSEGRSRDTLVIKNPNDKANQTFFRRSGGKVGDVISLIRENINSFHVSGRNEWEITAKVLAKFANEPIPEYGNSEYLRKAGYVGEQVFDPNRYDVQPFDASQGLLMAQFARRGLTAETVRTFAPFLVNIKYKNTAYPYPNLGFPYREPDKEDVVGYEIRGYNGFKGKAAGTNSSSAAWIVDFSHGKDPFAVKNVYFAESGYDIMAFWQANKERLDKKSSVFVSIGGTFSEKQVTGIMQHYSEARAMDCFDNDLAGRMYGIRMAALLERMAVGIVKSGNDVRIQVGDKEVRLPEDKVSLTEFARHFPLRYKVGQWKAPVEFKDWNDVVLNKPMKELTHATVFQRNENLEKARQVRM